jgi:transposase-like protein
MNLLQVAKTFATEDQALDYLVNARWPNGVRCIACDHDKVWRIDTKGKTGKPCRLFECADCGLHFSATTGTLFNDSHLPLTKWFAAMALMVEAKKGISANQVARHIGCSYKTAWYLCHRIRKAMEDLNAPALGGPGKIVEVDETFIGGKSHRKGVGVGKSNKISVLAMAERNGRVHMQTIDNAKAATLRPLLRANISPETDKVVTDAAAVYTILLPAEKHEEIVSKDSIRDRGFSATYTVDGAVALFKRGVVGSYHKLSKDHLDSYLQEFSWRWNKRHMQPWLFDILLREVANGKPLTFKTLTREIF